MQSLLHDVWGLWPPGTTAGSESRATTDFPSNGYFPPLPANSISTHLSHSCAWGANPTGWLLDGFGAGGVLYAPHPRTEPFHGLALSWMLSCPRFTIVPSASREAALCSDSHVSTNFLVPLDWLMSQG